MQTQLWQKLTLILGTAALVALLMPKARKLVHRHTVLPRQEPDETGRWESEGGGVPGANLAVERNVPVTAYAG